MFSPRLEQCFETNCNPDKLKSRLENILCSIDPEYAQAFNDYRKSILNTLEHGSQV